MKIPVIDYPERPCDCLFVKRDGDRWVCKVKSWDDLSIRYCKDTSECPYLLKGWLSRK